MSLSEYYRAWEQRARALNSPPPSPQRQPPTELPDLRDIKAGDIGVRFGRPLTAEQFAEYRKRRAVNVISPPQEQR